MPFQPAVNQELVIDGVTYYIAEHPAAPGMPYGQEGRAAIVYQLVAGADRRALKVFKPRYRLPALVGLADKLAAFADMPGLQVCRRAVLTPQRHAALLRQYPDLTYAVLMPWVEGPTWMEVLLDRRELSAAESLNLARSLAEILSTMEQRGLAHCDLSSPNVLLPALAGERLSGNPLAHPSAVALVDVEQVYAPGLTRPDPLTSGSSGYAHKTAPEGIWAAHADRFAGAVLLAEMLGSCDPQVVEAAWGESYFDPGEMQQDSPRYRTLLEALRRTWGEGVAALFERAWRSDTLADCPTFGEWLIALPERPPAAVGAGLAPALGLAPAPEGQPQGLPLQTDLLRAQVQALMQVARQLEDQGNLEGALTTYRQAQALAAADPALASLAREIESSVADLEGRRIRSVTMQAPSPAVSVPPPTPTTRPEMSTVTAEGESLQDLFERGLIALQHQVWEEAYACFDAVYKRDPNYQQAGQRVWILRSQVDRARVKEFQRWKPIRLFHIFGIKFLLSNGLIRPVVWSVAFSADGKHLFAVGVDGKVRRINIGSGKIAVWEKNASEHECICIACHSDRILALGLYGGSIQIRDTDGILLRTLKGHTGRVNSVAFSPDGTLLASGSDDAMVKVWRVADGALLRTLEGHTGSVNSVAFSPDGVLLASGSDDATVKVWRVADGHLLHTFNHMFNHNYNEVYSVAFSPDGALLASGSGDETVKVWRVADGALLRTLEGHAGQVWSVAFSPDGQILASTSYSIVGLWRVSDGQILRTLKGHKDWVYSVAFSPDGALLASGSLDGTVRLWGVRP